jgi:hypothetical protein
MDIYGHEQRSKEILENINELREKLMNNMNSLEISISKIRQEVILETECLIK